MLDFDHVQINNVVLRETNQVADTEPIMFGFSLKVPCDNFNLTRVFSVRIYSS